MRPTWDKKSQAWVELPPTVNNSYVAHLGGPERLGELVWSEAKAEAGTKAETAKSLAMRRSGFGTRPANTFMTVPRWSTGIRPPII